MILAFVFIGLSIACRAVGELTLHQKLRGQTMSGFWGDDSSRNKYKLTKPEGWVIDAKDNWYTRLFKIKYKERWFTSTNFTVLFTDGYHLTQSISFITLSLGIGMLSGIGFWFVWLGVLITHATIYRVMQR